MARVFSRVRAFHSLILGASLKTDLDCGFGADEFVNGMFTWATEDQRLGNT